MRGTPVSNDQRPRRVWRMRTRLSIALLLVFAPMSVLIVLSHIDNTRDRRESRIQSLETINESIAASIDGFSRDLESFTLSTAISLGEVHEPLTQDNIGQYLKDLNDSYGILRSVFVTDLAGRVVAGTSGNVGFDISSRDYLKALQSGAGSVWSDAVAGAQTGQTTLAYGRPIRDSNGETRNFLIIAFYPDQLLSRLPQNLPDNATLGLIGKNGVVLFTSQDQGAESPLRDVSQSSIFARARAGQPVLVRDSRTPLDTSPGYGSFLPLARTGWVVGFTVPASAVDGPLQTRFQRDLLILGLTLAGGFATMLIIASRLSTPLTNLAEAAMAIARGERPLVPTQAADADVMELERAMETMSKAISLREQHLRTMAVAGITLSEDLDYEATFRRLAEVLIGDIADWCLIHVEEAGTLRQVAIAHRDPDKVETARQIERQLPADPDGSRWPRRVIRSGRAELVADIDGEILGERFGDPELMSILRGFGIRSYLCVPVQTHESVLGAMTLVSAESGRRLTGLDLELARDLGRRAGIAIANARLYRDSQMAREELLLSNQQKDEFLGILAHELRTPLTSIYGGARLVNNKSRNLPDKARRDLLETIEVEALRMTRLVENLLLLARAEMGKAPEMQSFSIAELVRGVGYDLRKASPQRQIEFEAKRSRDQVWSDPTRLEQVVHNLVTNADKYSPPNAPIRVEVGGTSRELIVRVFDSGPGVDPGELNLMFESFYRSASTSSQAPGKGLGLAVCKRLVESLDGRIWAKNRAGGGLEVGFAVPLQAAPGHGRDAPRELPLSEVSV